MKSANLGNFLRMGLAALGLGLVTRAHAEAPQVSASLRGVVSQGFEQGEPWRVTVRLDLPRGSQETVNLAPATGTWADAVAVELFPVTGTLAVARAEAVGKPDSSQATLDAQHVAGGLWRFSPTVMQTVAPGPYVLRVRLAIASGSGWTGAVSAREIPVTVVPAATEPSTPRIVNRAQDLLSLGQVQVAATTVDAGLKRSPRDYALLKVRAEIAERAGNPLAAILCLNAATFSPGTKKVSGPPPLDEIELRDRFEKSRRATLASAPPPPAWTWPPAEVLLALSDEAKSSGFVPALLPELSPGTGNTITPAVVSASAVSLLAIRTAPASASPTQSSWAVPGSRSSSILPAPGEIVPSTDLNDAIIAADTTGQWAAGATAGSQYGNSGYAALKATSAPDVPIYGDSPSAWCPAGKNSGTDWLEVSFARAVSATGVRIRQSNCPGAIVKIEAFGTDGIAHVWWEGTDAYKPSAVRDFVWFGVRIPRTSYLVEKVKITLDLAAVPGWKQIDAVQLVGTSP